MRYAPQLLISLLILFVVQLGVFAEDIPGSTADATVVSETPTPDIFLNRATLPNGIALGPRIGGYLFQCQNVPMGVTNTNGIRGNFLFNGPTIPTIGFGARIALNKFLRFAPSIDFTFDEYVYRTDLGQAFLTQSMTGSSVGPVATVIGFMISMPLWFDINLSDRVILSLAPGIAIYPRVALIPIDNSSGIESISASLNADARWLYPQTGVSIKYAIDASTSVGFEIQVLYPLSHIGKNDNMGLDGLILTGGFSFDLYL